MLHLVRPCGKIPVERGSRVCFQTGKTVGAGYFSIKVKQISFLYRAGYLTLFGGEQNNNGTDPSSVYEEYKKFDGLLTKMARGTLKPGSDA